MTVKTQKPNLRLKIFEIFEDFWLFNRTGSNLENCSYFRIRVLSRFVNEGECL
jgi:hypothetical protein